MRKIALAGILFIGLLSNGLYAYEKPPVVPWPKEIKFADKEWDAKKISIITGKNAPEKVKIGADIIKNKIASLGGEAQISDDGASAQGDITIRAGVSENSGEKHEQGYSIKCSEINGKKIMTLEGDDEQGALYACVTAAESADKTKRKTHRRAGKRQRLAGYKKTLARLSKNAGLLRTD